MRFNTPFFVDEWKKYLSNRLSPTEYKAPAEEVKTKHTIVDDLLSLGTLKLDDGLVPLYHMKLNAKTTPRARVSITRAAYDTIKNDTAIGSALFFITYANDPKYRLSYVKYDRNLKSDPKRYTYLLGKDVPTHTPETRLKPQAFESIEAMEEAFSVEPVNREFYQGIQGYFQKLKETLGGTTEDGDRAIRFIGRLLFCRFLTAKGLVPSGLLEEAASAKKSYQTVLAPLFFQILNKEHGTRTVLPHHEKDIPFLNGGLFAPKEGEESLPIGDNLIHDIFAFLKKYNFTVDESTPTEVEISIDPEMLGRVFENLLAEINPDTRESARKATGAFYTPREIVDYMVVESLKKYLHNHIKIEECRLSALFSTINDHDLSSTEIKDTIKALKDLKILDPACGSGAFPMGLLQRLFDLRQDLHQKIEGKPLASVPSAYQLKKEILQNCIYGVDIQPIAVEISKLRAFLSLVLEEEKTAPEAQNLGIQPLPNLEFNFIIANSLVGLEQNSNSDSRDLAYHQFNTDCAEIHKISQKYFNADSPEKKKEAHALFEAFRGRIQQKGVTYYSEEDKAKLLSFNPFTNSPAEFFEPHIQFGIESDKNFGIVIGNPPYGAKLSKEDKKYFKNTYITTKTISGKQYGMINTYNLFIERSFNLLDKNGVGSLIVPISVISAQSASGIHVLLEGQCEEISVSSYAVRPKPIFQNAVVNVSIISFVKTESSNKRILCTQMYRKSDKKGIRDIIAGLEFIDVKAFCTLQGHYPKISKIVEKNILTKITMSGNTIQTIMDKKGHPIFYRTSGGRYFKVVTNYSTGSTKEKDIYITKRYSDFIGALLSSNLFFWWYQIYSNNLDMPTDIIYPFPLPHMDVLTAEKLKSVSADYKKYLHSIESHSFINSGEIKEYRIGLSKSLIDILDDSILPLYGLDDTEIQFIKNYEIEFRIDVDE